MSFYQENKYYIIQNLQVGMRGLSLEDRQTMYNSISSEIRERIHKSYPRNNTVSGEVNNTELNIFYNELFELVGEFEINYIIGNLFFETNFTNISCYLKNNSDAFNKIMNSPYEEFTFKWVMCLYLKENDFFQSTFLNFLKEFICSHTNLANRDLEDSIRDNGSTVFEFVHKYPQWLMNNLIKEGGLDKLLLIHLMVIKLFNLNRIFINHKESNKFAILFLHYSSEYYKEKINNGETPRLSLFYSKMNGIIDSFYVKGLISKTPILDSSIHDYYTKGFYLKRADFLKNVEEAEILNNKFIDESFGDLFELYFSVSFLAKQKIIKVIINRIKCLEFPQQEDLLIIDKFLDAQDFDEFKTLINSKLYLFENHSN